MKRNATPHEWKPIDREVASRILKHPFDPAFPQRHLVQFTDEYLEELIHEARSLMVDLHAEQTTALDRATKTNSDKDWGDYARAMSEKRRIIGRLSAIIRELDKRGRAIPKFRRVK